MTHSPIPPTEPEPGSGPGPRNATRARRIALLGAAALLVAAGGATAAFASDGGETTYGTVVSTTEQSSTSTADVPPAPQDGATGGIDCPEKQGGAGDGNQPGAGTDSGKPETSTL
jgi:hypothetical protein